MKPAPPTDPDQVLRQLRQDLDHVDAQLLRLLSRRMELSQCIGGVKQVLGMPPLQPERWRQVLDTRLEQAAQHRLPRPLVHRLLAVLHRYSLHAQDPPVAPAMSARHSSELSP